MKVFQFISRIMNREYASGEIHLQGKSTKISTKKYVEMTLKFFNTMPNVI